MIAPSFFGIVGALLLPDRLLFLVDSLFRQSWLQLWWLYARVGVTSCGALAFLGLGASCDVLGQSEESFFQLHILIYYIQFIYSFYIQGNYMSICV